MLFIYVPINAKGGDNWKIEEIVERLVGSMNVDDIPMGEY